jgi:phosphopantothenoylcysteine decarboxylase / phosphopantothenate---cysteine ligase
MNVVLGVGGGIAAYKAAELVRLLEERGFAVRTVMTESAQKFVQPLTFASLTGRKVITGLFTEDILSSAIEHIQVARDNHALIVAPATAGLIGKFANGIADDFLTSLYLAFTGKVILAPAMNTNMWNHPATQRNVEMLLARGHGLIGPGDGKLACGTTGPGRLMEPAQIAEFVEQFLMERRDLEGETILVTAGPTQEALDPVRYITNRSSGKMGYSIAEAALARGAKVILVSGPVHLTPPAGAQTINVQSALEMRQAVMDRLAAATIIVKSAAVADYHVANIPDQKVKKTAARFILELDPTPDILAEVGRIKGDRLLVGFAAETQNMVAEARRKLESKNCDMLVGNLVNRSGTGFESDENEVTLVLSKGATVNLKRASKRVIADQIFDHLLKLRLALHAAQ